MNIQITIWLIFVFASLINSVLDLKTMHISLLLNYLCLGFTVFLCVLQKINIAENIISGILLFFIFLVTRKLSNNGLGMGDVHYSLYCGFLSSVFTSILSALLAALLCLFVFLIIFFINGKSRIKLLKLPFVPFLFVATVLGNLVTWGMW